MTDTLRTDLSSVLSPVLHPASGTWMVGKIENHTARPLTRAEVDRLIDALQKPRSREALEALRECQDKAAAVLDAKAGVVAVALALQRGIERAIKLLSK